MVHITDTRAQKVVR